MQSRLPKVAAVVLLGSWLVSGCSKSTTAPAPTATSDQAQVAATLGQSTTLVDDGLAQDTSSVAATGAAVLPATIMAAVRPYSWWQTVSQVTSTWSFAFADTDSTGRPRTCTATLTKHIVGALHIIPVSPADSTQPDTTRIVKPFDKTLTRKVLLSRIALGNSRVWKVVMITGAFVTTPSATTHIVSIRLHSSSGVDTTITDPLQYFALRHIIRFGTLDTVTVTATTTRLNDVVVIHRWDWRHRLHNNGDYTYSFTWVTSAWGGWRHFGIQAMSHGTLYDDTQPFDSQAWHLPFRVSQPDVDYYP